MNKPLSSKYHPLTLHLHAQAGDRVRMTFAEIERVIGGKLPPSAASRAWWSNNPSNNVMTKAWLETGRSVRPQARIQARGAAQSAGSAVRGRIFGQTGIVRMDARHDRDNGRFDRARRFQMGRAHRR